MIRVRNETGLTITGNYYPLGTPDAPLKTVTFTEIRTGLYMATRDELPEYDSHVEVFSGATLLGEGEYRFENGYPTFHPNTLFN